MGNQRFSGFNNSLFEPINLSLSPRRQTHSPTEKNTVLKSLLQPPLLTSPQAPAELIWLTHITSRKNRRRDLQNQIPPYVCDILQQNGYIDWWESLKDKPNWYTQLLTASAVTVPVLVASTVTYHSLLGERWFPLSLLDTTLRDVFLIQGLLSGCTIPLDKLSISWFRESLGDYYEAYVQTVRVLVSLHG